MNLLTEAQRQHLLANGLASQDQERDHVPVIKLFTPDAHATWLLTEIDPADQDRAFGLCDLGLGCPELGYVSLSELAEFRGPLGLRIERDQHFTASRTLTEYAAEAHRAGRIRS